MKEDEEPKKYEVVIVIKEDHEKGIITRSLQRIPVDEITNIRYEKRNKRRSALWAKVLFTQDEEEE